MAVTRQRQIARGRRRPAQRRWPFRPPWPVARPDASLLGLACLLGVLVAVVAYVVALPPTRTSFDLATPPDDVTLRGFYGPEINAVFTFRWARPTASLSIPLAAPADYRVTVRVGDNPALGGARTVRFYAYGREIGTVVTGDSPREATFVVRSDGDLWRGSGRALHLELESPAIVPSADPRPLGPFLTSVRVEPLARRYPSGQALLVPFVLLLSLAFGLRRLGLGSRRVLITLGVCIAGIALFSVFRRADALATLIGFNNPAPIVALTALLVSLPLLRGQPEPTPAWPSAGQTRASWLVLGVIVAIGAVLRGYRLVELAPFQGDQGRDALVLWRMLKDHLWPTLGPWSSVGDFSRGPAYYYLLYLPFQLAGGHAVSAAAVSAAADCGAIVLFFLIGRRLCAPWAGLVAAGLWSVAPLALLFARMGWNPNPLPCLVLLLVYSLLRIAQGEGRFLALALPAWSLAWQLHDQALLLLPLACAWLWLRHHLRLRHYAVAVAATALTLLPYIAGEFRRGFANTRAMASYIRQSLAGGSGTGRDWGRHATEVVRNIDSLLPGIGGDWLHWTMRALALLGVLALVARLRASEQRPVVGVLALWALVLPLYLLWPGPAYYHYLLAGFPLPFLAVGLGADLLRRGRVAGRPLAPLVAGGVAALVGAGAATAFGGLRASPPGTYLTAERVVDRIIADAGAAPFAFRFVGSWSYDGTAYQYLFAYRGRWPAAGDGLPTYTIFSPRDQGEGPRYRGVIIDDVKIVRTDQERPQAGPNLLLDEGFVAHMQLPAPAYVISPRPGWSVSDRSAIHVAPDADGRALLGLTGGTGDRPVVVEQTVAVAPGRRYRVSFDYRTGPRCEGAVGQPVQVRIAERYGSFLATVPDPFQPPLRGSADWTSVAFVATVPPAGAVATVRLVGLCADELWLRDVEMREDLARMATPAGGAPAHGRPDPPYYSRAARSPSPVRGRLPPGLGDAPGTVAVDDRRGSRQRASVPGAGAWSRAFS